jgi:hypothetical protein
MRIQPPGPWSPGLALIRWPNASSRWEARVAILYPDRESLLSDYHRSARWSHEAGIVARTHSLRLEKAPDGQPWISFGVRQYLDQSLAARSPNGKVLERPDDRIAVRILEGGKCRTKAIKQVDEADELTVIFNTFDEEGPDAFNHQARRLNTDHLGYMAGTEPIPLSGLFTLGLFVPTKGWRNRQAAKRRLKRSCPR